jgi:hypothetical protein
VEKEAPVPSRPVVAALLAVLVAVAPGCYSKRGRAAERPRTVSVVVTRDFGAGRVAAGSAAAAQSVLAALEQVAHVRTAYGGRFVDAVDGVSGGSGGTRGWVYFVNGIEAGVGALDVSVRAGDRVWWDDRYFPDVERALHAPVPVGLFPEPFVHGWQGVRPPVAVRGSAALRASLRRAGVHVVAGQASWRVLVGSDADLRRDPAYRRVAGDPRASGVTAALAGGRVVVYDGRTLRAVPDARAVVSALAAGSAPAEGVVLAGAGLDRRAARRAAAAVARRPGLLALRYAAAFDGDGRLVATGGRP